MKPTLYYGAGSCSMSCKIIFEEAKIPHEAVLIDFDVPAQAAEVNRMNPAGALPILVQDGKILTQNIAILEHFADLHPEAGVLPKAGTWERAETLKWLSFVASDLHKAFAPLFGLDGITKDAGAKADVAKWSKDNVATYLKIVDDQLANHDYIAGNRFTVADAYLFVVASWSRYLDISLAPYSRLSAYLGRIREMASVKKVLKEAGLA